MRDESEEGRRGDRGKNEKATGEAKDKRNTFLS